VALTSFVATTSTASGAISFVTAPPVAATDALTTVATIAAHAPVVAPAPSGGPAPATPVSEPRHVPPLTTTAPTTAAPTTAPAPRSYVAPPTTPTRMPPYFSGDALRFATVDEVLAVRNDLTTVGAVLAVCDHAPPLKPVDVRVHAGSREARTRLRCTLHGMQPGTLVVQATDKAAWATILDELTGAAPATVPEMSRAPLTDEKTSSSASSSTPASAPAGASARMSTSSNPLSRALSMPRSGHLKNPPSAGAVCAMPLHRPFTDADVQRPTLGLLLRWLRTTRGVVKVDFTRRGLPVVNAVFVDGREVRSSLGSAALGRALAEDELDYTLEDLPRAPNLGNVMRTLHLVVDYVRALLARHTIEDIARAFPLARETRLVRAVSSVVEALGFSGAHARLIKATLDGDGTIEDVLDNPIGPRTAWDVLVLLHLYDGLAFTAGDRKVAATATTAATGLPAEAMLDKDLFSVLGLHWSAAPSEVGPAYQQAKQAWNGPRRPSNERLAQSILARIEDAYRTLRDDERRRSYRKATFNMVWSHQAQLLVTQAKLSLYRKDMPETTRLLQAAEDLSPSAEAAQLLASIAKSGAPKG